MDRREFLKKSMLLTAGALIGGSLFSETSAAKGAKQNGIPRKKKSIGLQLYSIGGDMSADAAQALRQISEMDTPPPKRPRTETGSSTAARRPSSAKWPRTSASR